MLQLDLSHARQVLCVGAHADDIEIGCGGSLLQMAQNNPSLNVVWVVFSAEGKRAREARRSAGLFLQHTAKRSVLIKKFRMSYFPFEGSKIKDFFEQIAGLCHPDVIFTHYREDRHQDHRVISDLTWNTFRNHLILEYEIPKYDGDLGQPNVFVPLPPALCAQKAANLQECFRSQSAKHWFSADTFLGLMRLRGVECASATRFAEAFYCRKLTFKLT